MPQLVAAAAAIAASVSAAVTAAAATLGITASLSSLALTALKFGLSFGLNAILGGQSRGGTPASSRTLVGTESDAARKVALGGPVQVGGAVQYEGVSKAEATDNEFIRLQVFNAGPVNAITGYQLDGEEATIDGSGWVQTPEKWQDRVRIITTDGDVDAVALPEMIAAFPDWTSAHRGRGLATAMISQKSVPAAEFVEVYPRQKLALTPIIQGRPDIWDPRDDSVVYSNNAALCALWFMTAPLIDGGMGIARAKVDTASWGAAADICDQDVPLNGGGSEKRFRCAGQFSMADARIDTFRALLANFDAEIALAPDGTIGVNLLTDITVPPERVFTDDHIVSFTARKGPGLLRRKQEGVATYVDPDRSFADSTTPVRIVGGGGLADAERLALELLWCPSGTQAQRLLKRALERENPDYIATVTLQICGVLAPQGSVLRLDSEVDPWGDGWFMISNRMSDDGLTRILSLRSVVPPSWDPATDEQAVPIPPVATVSETSYAIPDGVTAVAEGVQVNLYQSGVRIAVRWTNGKPELDAEVEHKRGITDAEWEPSQTVPSGRGIAYTPLLFDGDTYSVRVRFLSPSGVPTAWVEVGGVTAFAASAPLPAPTVTAPSSVAGGATYPVTVALPDEFFVAAVRLSVDGVAQPDRTATGGTVTFTLTAPATAGSVGHTAQTINQSGLASAASTVATTAIT